MDFLTFIAGVFTDIKSWAASPTGFVLLCTFVVLVWVFRKREKQFKKLSDEMQDIRDEMEIAFMECRADSAIDNSSTEALRNLFIELRGFALSMCKGGIPTEMQDLEMRYAAWRKDRHDERNRRIVRAQIAIDRAREENNIRSNGNADS